MIFFPSVQQVIEEDMFLPQHTGIKLFLSDKYTYQKEVSAPWFHHRIPKSYPRTTAQFH